MNYLNPIYTEKRECQDCYKCLRNCPVKAIKVEGGYASVMPELCIVCGQCVEVCPNNAKRVRDDLPTARRLLASGREVYVSLAPSFISEFPELRAGQLIRAFRQLGFRGVSETALGAQQVSAQAAADLREQRERSPVFFSSACPTVVRFLQKHRPADSAYLTPLHSPLITHCKMLRAAFGASIGVVFVGPCIAKKLEAAEHPGLLDVVLTFEDLRRWLEQEKVDPAGLEETAEDHFVPGRADEGCWYPVDGGMIAGMKSTCAVNDASVMAFSGLGAIEKAISGLGDAVSPTAAPSRAAGRGESALPAAGGLFLELLACEGGCVNGPRAAKRDGTAAKRCRVLRYGRAPEVSLPRASQVDIRSSFAVVPPAEASVPDAQIREALRLVGKLTRDDELNCGGCGYDTCRQFALALLGRKAERSMCVTYMRKLALKKANALIQKMPSAVVIVGEAMRIIEHNGAFARMFGQTGAPPQYEGVMLSEVMPFASLFHGVLKSGQEVLERDLRHQQTILHATIFSIEKHCLIGAILQDITEPAVRKEQVIRRAQEVIQRSLATTQEIARLLGESAAESEITLNSIIESFSPPRTEEPPPEHDWRKLYRR